MTIASESSSSAAPLPLVGGQAVIEGVLMRSPKSISIVCRRRNGELVVRERPYITPRHGWRTWPLLRGVATIVDSLRLGSRALRWSVQLYEQDHAEPARKSGTRTSTLLATSVAMFATRADDEPTPPPPSFDDDSERRSFAWVAPVAMALTLFVALPQGIAELVSWLLGLDLPITSPAYQAITGVAKLAVIVGYLSLIRRIPEVKRVFQYHGAEHKTISTFEAREQLTVENARSKTTLHARCGTTFLVMVALVSVLSFSVVGALLPPIPGGRLVQSIGFLLLKLPMLPLVAAVTFELQRALSRMCTSGPVRVLLAPGFWVQGITTSEPDDEQLEVALASLQATSWREAAVTAPVRPDRVFDSYGKLVADPGYTVI